MKEMSSAEFRKAYPRLEEPTVVTANGHVIGTWLPLGRITQTQRDAFIDTLPEDLRPITRGALAIQSMSQSDRDAVLRRMSKKA